MSEDKPSQSPAYEGRLPFETLLADLSSKFVNLPADEVDSEILDAQRRICGLLDLDFSALWQWSDQASGGFTLTQFYSAQTGPQLPVRMSQDQYPWARQQLLAGRVIKVSSLEDLPTEAVRDRETLRQFGIRSNLAIPLSVGGEAPMGMLGLGTTLAERDWPEAIVKRVQAVAQVFANALARKRGDQALRASEARLAAGADLAGLGYYEMDYGAGSGFADDRFRDICGVPADVQQGLESLAFWMKQVHPDDLQQVLDLRQHLHDGRLDQISTEYRFLHPVQGQKWIHHLARLATGTSTGQGVRTIGVIRDISDRKRVEQDQRDLSRRLIRVHEEERARLARDLHDDVTQRLARLAIDAGRAEHAAGGVSKAETMRSIREGLVSLSEDVHALSYRLHPSVLEDLGLAEALRAECERFSQQTSVGGALDLGELPASIPSDTALCLFRVAQEALRNVTRHARARRAELSLLAQDGHLHLAVRDDGVGFEPGLHRDVPSLGLASMRERVHLLGGELDVQSAPGQGTTILVRVPLTSAP